MPDYQQTCPECGLMHPPVAPGMCPVAKENKLKEEITNLRSEKCVRLMQAIQTKLIEIVTKSQSQEAAESFLLQLFKDLDK